MKASQERLPAHALERSRAERASVPDVSPRTFAQLYNEHFDFVWRNARRLGVPEENADDVAQDVFVVVHRRAPDFDGRATWRAWIFGILVRVVRDHRRRFRRKSAPCVPLDEEQLHGGHPSSPESSPLHRAEQAERVRLVERLLGELDEDKRTLLILSEFEQWTLREIAEYTGSNTNTVYSRLRAARRAFELAHSRFLAETGGAS